MKSARLLVCAAAVLSSCASTAPRGSEETLFATDRVTVTARVHFDDQGWSVSEVVGRVPDGAVARLFELEVAVFVDLDGDDEIDSNEGAGSSRVNSGFGARELRSASAVSVGEIDGFDPQLWKIAVRANFADASSAADADATVVPFADL